jgi:hypothetical protein
MGIYSAIPAISWRLLYFDDSKMMQKTREYILPVMISIVLKVIKGNAANLPQKPHRRLSAYGAIKTPKGPKT